MTTRIRTRLGDGGIVEMTPSEIREDIITGSELGARRAKAPCLTEAEVDHLVDIFSSEAKFSAVDMGDEVCLSFDGSGNLDSGSRVDELYNYQSHHGADMLELFGIDYSYKAIKTIISWEAQAMKNAQLNLIAPIQYGAMPDLGRYSMPDGPIPNWSELMPLGRIDEARDAQVAAIEHAVSDMVFVADGMWEAGADGMDFDTAGAAGDGDLLAALTAVETIKGRHPDIGIEFGMASEYVLGMHGELTYKGRRLAGMWPRDQLLVAQEAGATMFGPAVNVNTTKSIAWNVARACTIIKPAMNVAEIPVHPNVGMGVGGVPMSPYPPADAVSRVSRALVDILGCDGL
jgi:dimethylamine---corrinoid protein Co-methyltransferase